MTDFDSDFVKDFDPEWKQKSEASAAEDDGGRLLHRWGEVYDDAQ